jgi:hypothetical protein
MYACAYVCLYACALARVRTPVFVRAFVCARMYAFLPHRERTVHSKHLYRSMPLIARPTSTPSQHGPHSCRVPSTSVFAELVIKLNYIAHKNQYCLILLAWSTVNFAAGSNRSPDTGNAAREVWTLHQQEVVWGPG